MSPRKKSRAKSARKSTYRKKSATAKRPSRTVRIKDSLASDKHVRLKRMVKSGKPQTIVWKGVDRSYKVQFVANWPFKTKWTTIRVPHGRPSRKLTVSLTANSPDHYGYTIVPAPKTSKKKPSPEVIVSG